MLDILPEDLDILTTICQAIFEKKGFNILTLDVRKISSMTDYCVIAEGNVEKHVQAISQQIQEKMLELGRKPLHVEGKHEGDWIAIDYSGVLVHLFIPEMREKYALEELWEKSSIVDVPIKIHTS